MAQMTPPPSSSTTTVGAPAGRSVNGRLRLTYPTRGYALSRNPFVVSSILPLIVGCFIALAITEHFGDHVVLVPWFNNAYTAEPLGLVAFLIVTLGLLLIPAVSLKGSLNFTHDGIIFERGRQHFTAAWNQVTGVVNRTDCGLCLSVMGPQLNGNTMRMPGGMHGDKITAQIPLRYFGDRMYSILYDIRDRLQENAYLPALSQVDKRSANTNLVVYAAVTLVCAIAMIIVAISVLNS